MSTVNVVSLLQDVSEWEIWIDDVNGELAMDKNDRAVRKESVLYRDEVYTVLEGRLAREVEISADIATCREIIKDAHQTILMCGAYPGSRNYLRAMEFLDKHQESINRILGKGDK